MDNHGIRRFYYAKQLPARAVAIANVRSTPSLPSDLTDIRNTPFGGGALTATPAQGGPAVDAAVPGNTVVLSGHSQYLLENQFFELTNEVDATGSPYYFRHPLPSNQVEQVSIVGLDGTPVTSGWKLSNGEILHDLDGAAYRVSYYDHQALRRQLLQYQPVMTRALAPAARNYSLTPGGLLSVVDAAASYRLRFTGDNSFSVLPPYGVPPSDPWHVRVRFNLRPVLPEWANQPFLPVRPYLQASWVPGRVLASDLIEFERSPIWFDPMVGQYPDILVYDKNYQLRLALDGVPVSLSRPNDKGYLFPWRTSQIVDMDPARGRVQVNVDLEPGDVVFGFYSYGEPDFVFRALDVNPFSNPDVKDRLVEFYWADRSYDIPPRP